MSKPSAQPLPDVGAPQDSSTEPLSGTDSNTKVTTGDQGIVSVSEKVKGGTVCPSSPFYPSNDAEVLRKAMKGLGTDEEAIIGVLSKRTKIERQAIAKAYQGKYNEDLLEELESELGGNFKAVCQHLMWKDDELDARAIRKAMEGFGTDEAVLIEILCTRSGREINEIKRIYAQIFKGRDLLKDVENETSGHFKTFLLAILKGNRDAESDPVVPKLAESDAKALFDMVVKNWNPSNPSFLQIFTQRSFQHLQRVFTQCWVKLTSGNLIASIDRQSRGDLKQGLKTIIRFSTCIPPVYYAIQIHDAMAGRGTEDKRLIYVITTRSEIDLIDIKEEYLRRNNMELAKRIEEETSGDYRKMLLDLLN